MLPDALTPPICQVFHIDKPPLSASSRPAWLAEPSPAHRHLHELCPVALVVDAFNQLLAQPVQLASNRNGRFATVLGAYLFHFEESGSFLTWRWTPRGPVPIGEHDLALQRMVSDRDWLQRNINLLGTLLFESVQQSRRLNPQAHPSQTPVPPTTRAYGRWLMNEIAQPLLTPPMIERVQQSVQQTLAVKNELLRKAASLPARAADRRGASVGDYNLMITNGAKICQIRQDSPMVADLYPLFCDAPGFNHELEPAAALRRYLLENGVNQSTWRALCAIGAAQLEPLLALYDAPRDEAMLDLLNCLRALRIRQPTQLWALAHLFSTFGAHGNRPLRYLKSIEADPILAHILTSSPRCESPTDEQIDELDIVLRWTMDEHIAEPDKRQRQAGWQWLVKQARHWQQREQQRLTKSQLQWQAAIAAISIDQLTFHALTSELALWDEAIALHHCADVYGLRCRQGAYLVYSVRLPAKLTGSPNDRRVATLALSRLGSRWTIDQLVGPANTDVDDAVRQSALILVNLLNPPSAAGSDQPSTKSQLDR